MKNRIIQIFLLGLLSACSGNKDSVETVPLNCDEYNNKYYILDQSALRTVVSFKKDGTPILVP